MRVGHRSTVDRLDNPSAYYQSRVSFLRFLSLCLPCYDFDSFSFSIILQNTLTWEIYIIQNKRRRPDHGRDGKDGDTEMGDAKPEEPEDPLRNATTLYVGNLLVSFTSSLILVLMLWQKKVIH